MFARNVEREIRYVPLFLHCVQPREAKGELSRLKSKTRLTTVLASWRAGASKLRGPARLLTRKEGFPVAPRTPGRQLFRLRATTRLGNTRGGGRMVYWKRLWMTG